MQDLGTLAGSARSAAEAGRLVAQALGRAAKDIPATAVYLRTPGTDELALAASSPPETSPAPFTPGPGDSPAVEVLRSGQPVTLTDGGARFATLPVGGWETPPTQAMMASAAR